MKNIIITGGELLNKGAQAMTFIAVNEVKKRFPNHEIYVLSEMDMCRSEEEKRKYAFKFMGWYPIKFAKCQSNPLLRLICIVRNGRELREAEAIYKNTDMMIDISGYALGSNWSKHNCNYFLDHLEFAHAFHIPMYLMPQSFGPFEFIGKDGERLEKRIRKLLPRAKVICAREKSGYEALIQKYHLCNVLLSYDLVLNNKRIDLKNIFKEIPQLELPNIEGDAVGIVPNIRIVEAGGEEKAFKFYEAIIKELLRENKRVYVLSHATQDFELCKKISILFANEGQVVFLNQEFSCLEFGEIVKKFHFVVASRFHAIVHAYKNGVPCISLGWAIKYHDLLAEFGQENYFFDVHKMTNTDALIRAVSKLNEYRDEEAARIGEHLSIAQENNIFDILSL